MEENSLEVLIVAWKGRYRADRGIVTRCSRNEMRPTFHANVIPNFMWEVVSCSRAFTFATKDERGTVNYNSRPAYIEEVPKFFVERSRISAKLIPSLFAQCGKCRENPDLFSSREEEVILLTPATSVSIANRTNSQQVVLASVETMRAYLEGKILRGVNTCCKEQKFTKI